MSQRKGVLLVALSSVLFGIVPVLVKNILEEGMALGCSLAYRSFWMMVFSWLLLKRENCSLKLDVSQIRDILLFGFFGYGFTLLLLSSSYLFIPMGFATVCHFIYPVLVVLIMRVIFKEKLNIQKWIAILLTLTGLFILACYNGGGAWKGMAIAAGSGLAYGTYVISLDKSSLRTLEKSVISFYVSLECGLAFLIQSLVMGEFQLVTEGMQMFSLSGSAVLSVIAMITLAEGIRILGASKAAFINMLEPLTNLGMDFICYGIVPSSMQWLGNLLILGAVGTVALQKDSSSI